MFGFWNHFVAMFTLYNGGRRPHMPVVRQQWQIVQAFKRSGYSVLDANAHDFTVAYCEAMDKQHLDQMAERFAA